LQGLVDAEEGVKTNGLPQTKADMRRLKAMGFSDARLAELAGSEEEAVRKARREMGVRPVYKRIDTCAAEFESLTPYMYSTYETDFNGHADCESDPSDRKKAIILGGGPN
ncbi:MAG TPA: carbamoyl phosphate synthase large subunit, partial [Rhodobiaceae bacterium]|nr:carbamoyl phosphate synthase large subunit [Rhodobiaceae bacterium]